MVCKPCLAPDRDLVQIVTGYEEVGRALVNGGVGKLIFVGSTEGADCFLRP